MGAGLKGPSAFPPSGAGSGGGEDEGASAAEERAAEESKELGSLREEVVLQCKLKLRCKKSNASELGSLEKAGRGRGMPAASTPRPRCLVWPMSSSK